MWEGPLMESTTTKDQRKGNEFIPGGLRRDRWDQHSGLQWFSILNNFMKAPGLLSIVVSEEAHVWFCDPKEEAPDPYGALEQVHPYHEKVNMVDPIFCWGSNRYQLPLHRKDSLSRAGVAAIARLMRSRRMRPACTGSSGSSPQDSCWRIPRFDLVPATVWWEKMDNDGYAIGLDRKRWLLKHRRNYLEGGKIDAYIYYPNVRSVEKLTRIMFPREFQPKHRS